MFVFVGVFVMVVVGLVWLLGFGWCGVFCGVGCVGFVLIDCVCF